MTCLSCAGCVLLPVAAGVVSVAGAVSVLTDSGAAAQLRGTAPMSCPNLYASQGFGDTPWEHPHTGIDIVCPPLTPVHAVSAGAFRRRSDLVSRCPFFPGHRGGYGLYGVVTSADGTQYVYAHLDSFAAADGALLDPGSVIGFEGSSGCSSGYHLHFEVRVRGTPVNPCPYLPAGYPSSASSIGRCWVPAPP